MAYYDNVNPTLLALVSPAAERICEFGCGAGAMASAIKEKSPGVHYVGVELLADELAKAASVLDISLQRNLDHITDWDLDAELSSALPQDSFDHVIFGDVLEHLYDPSKALAEATRRLKHGGSALVCIPNVQHWSVFRNLVLGRWPRDEIGLFDKTHIRWFALGDMVELLQTAGLVVESIVGRDFPSEEGLSIMEDLEPLARNLGVDPDELIRRGQVLQFVLLARKPC
jgi:SAM-dependent methyltransferase